MGWDGRRPGVTEITERTSVLKRRGCVVGVSVLFGELVGNLGDLLFFFMTCLVLPTSGVVYGAFVVRCLLFSCHCAGLRLGSRDDARCSGGWTVDEPCLHVRARADGSTASQISQSMYRETSNAAHLIPLLGVDGGRHQQLLDSRL
jgi:hypothetical protein